MRQPGLKSLNSFVLVFLFSLFSHIPIYSIGGTETPEESLRKYRNSLNEFRLEFGGSREMPDVKFFLFGMGNRAKLVYKNGILKNAISGEILKKWNISKEIIVPPDYSVYITLSDGSIISIIEDRNAVWIVENKIRMAVPGTETLLQLPDFKEYKYPQILKVLHQEILINIINGKPVPNFFVYKNPWRRDGAMMAMCLNATGNTNLIKDWALSLNDPYDRNNAGVTEADNLGETLFILSFFTNKDFPLVTEILKESKKFEIYSNGNKYIKGLTDDHEVPAYQTKWLKFGLKSLNLPDDYTIPIIEDDYSALFWWDYNDSYKPGTIDSDDKNQYPYLGWACDNFHGKKASPISNRDYPLTWEIGASEANYNGMAMVDEKYVLAKNSSPHTWHASEVFLYILKIN
ncbi:MAG: hypothetical protein Q8N05_00255 [Bacteroidota bacterium]|nr:hypothetical protein [Bacteroidota bacterium]